MERRRRIQRTCILAVVLGLHVSLIWLFLNASKVTAWKSGSVPMKWQALEMVYVVGSTASSAGALQNRANSDAQPRRRGKSAVSQSPATVAPALPDEERAMSPSPDWAGELGRAAKDVVAEHAAPQPRNFGFPHKSDPPAGKTPSFDWDYAATHRVEAIPEGGMIIHLNDRCVLVLMPLPFAFCGIGKPPANGTLFDHMRDPKAAGQ